jgi:DNA-binding PadR family transcriptional regulator
MSEFIRIQNKIDSLQHSESRYQLSVIGKELLTELKRIKKEHCDMLEMLNELISGNRLIRETDYKKIEKLIKEATQL